MERHLNDPGYPYNCINMNQFKDILQNEIFSLELDIKQNLIWLAEKIINKF